MRSLIALSESELKETVQEVIDRIHYREGFFSDLKELIDKYESPFSVDSIIKILKETPVKRREAS